MNKEQPKRTPQQIIGDDALTQLIFEGYEVVPARRSSDEQPEVVESIDYHAYRVAHIDPPGRASPPAVAAGGVTVTDAAVERALAALWKAQGLGWSQHSAMSSALTAALAVGDEGMREGGDHG